MICVTSQLRSPHYICLCHGETGGERLPQAFRKFCWRARGAEATVLLGLLVRESVKCVERIKLNCTRLGKVLFSRCRLLSPWAG